MRFIIFTLILFTISCTDSDFSGSDLASTIYDTESEAITNSPAGVACPVSGEVKTECVPTNRGKNGRCEDKEIDTRQWEIAYYRGDIDYNGTIADSRDIKLATKLLFVKAYDNQPCPAVIDITAFAGVSGRGEFNPDGYLTSNDVNLWRYVKKTGDFPLRGDVICQSDCKIINHMKK